MVENVNLAHAGWEARMYPRFARMSEDELRAMNGLLIDENEVDHFKNNNKTLICL
jgi:hypothetical protein